MAFRAKSSMHLISSSWCLWAMAYSRSRSPRRCRVGACSCRNAAAPNAGVAARCSRTSQSWRRSRNATAPFSSSKGGFLQQASLFRALHRFSAKGRADGAGTGVAGARAVWCHRRDGKIRAPCVIRGVSAAKRAPPWQDMRAMHSRTVLCSAFRMHGAHILPKPARFGCMAAICCQGRALFPSGDPSGMHEARKLPRKGVRECIGAISRHGKAPENASRENIATDGRPWTHHGEISPPSDVGGRNSRASCHRRAQGECIKA